MLKLSSVLSISMSGLLLSNTLQAAVYQVVELPGTDAIRNTFAAGINDNNVMIASGTDKVDFPIDLSNLNLTQLELQIATAKASSPTVFADLDFDAIEAGEINNLGHSFIKSFLISRQVLATTQKVGDRYAFVEVNGQLSELTVFDQVIPETGMLSRSTLDQANAINDQGLIALSATAPFSKVIFTAEPTETDPEPDENTFWQQNFFGRGVISNGVTQTVLTPEEATHGGFSNALDISNSGFVVGTASVAISTFSQEQIETICESERPLQPTQVCVQQLNGTSSVYQLRAFRWRLDQQMNLVEAKNLGMIFQPDEDNQAAFTSAATGINEAGIAVGFSPALRQEDDNFPTSYPVVFRDDEIIDFLNHDDYINGSAFDINNNNIVVGRALPLETINGFRSEQFFYYDLEANETVFPTGFFIGSAGVARAINDQNIIVGEAEFAADPADGGGNSTRHGFMYDINTDIITDLNTLLVCDSPYTIVETRDINNSGAIAATALTTVTLVDSRGEPVLEDDGTVATQEVPVAVKLLPIPNGQVDDCEPDVVIDTDRKGGSFGYLGLLLGLLLVWRRR